MIYNDIQLSDNGDGTFDWNFGYDDVVNVTGAQRRRSNIIHSVMLQPYELREELYAVKGCNVWNYVNERRTDHVITLLRESVRMTVNEIEGIRDSKVTITDKGEYGISIGILLFRNDGTEEVVEWSSVQNTQ